MLQNHASIMTVQGNISPAELGFCHSHEHLFIADGQSARIVPSLRIDDFDMTVAELGTFKNAGGASIVDAQPVGCGRMADYLLRASILTGVNIIGSTGFHKLVFYPQDHWIHSMGESDLINLFRSEIELGMHVDCDFSKPMQRIAAKAGVIKTASDTKGVSDKYIKLFNAAAQASKCTGAPILSHTEMGSGALEQIESFTAHRIPADSIIICHLDRVLDDLNYHIEVAKTGVFLELDTIGRFKYHSDEAEAELILKLIEHGYEDQILLGLDTTRERMKSYNGSIGLDYLQTSFIPLLRSYGVTDEIIEKFTIHNPTKAFSNKKIKLKGESL